MYLGDGLVNDTGISAVALAFFTALLAAISTTIIGIFQVKAKAVEAKNEANEAKSVALETRQEAHQARINTQNVSNGFADNVDRKLDRIIDKQTFLERSFRKHLEWHLDNPPRKEKP